jgi:hypothetical protein
MDMIEKVARAMCEANGAIWGGPRGVDDPDFLLVKLSYMGMARAAIEAMREPTPAMLAAGMASSTGSGSLSDTLEYDNRGEAELAAAFTAMIDAALPSPPVTEETK